MKVAETESILREFLAFLESKGMLTSESAAAAELVVAPAPTQPPVTQRKTIDVRTASELLGVSSGTLYNLVRERQIDFVRVRGRVLFTRDAIDTWLRTGGTAKQA